MATPALLFLDANASVPSTAAARAALIEALAIVGNPSSTHSLGRAARRALDLARDDVAQALGGASKEVFFTSGASEANRMVVDALVAAGLRDGAPLRVWTTPLEHPSLRRPLEVAAAAGRLHVDTAALTPEGAPLLDDALLARADVVILTAAHNETGVVPTFEAILRAVSPRALVVVDAAQALARIAPLPGRVDVITASAHKIGGVAGCGALLLRGNGRRLPAPWSGGGQEGGLRPGTEALPLIVAFGAAARDVVESRAQHAALAPLRDRLERALLAAWPGARAIGAAGARLPNTSAIVIPGVDGEALRMAIDRAGVCVGFGSACSALAPEPSPSLLALGLTAREARATVRLSLTPDVTGALGDALVDDAIARLAPIVTTLRAFATRP